MTNVYTKFKGLLANDNLDVVTITSNNGDGTSQATTLAGYTATVKGESVAAGNKAYIRNQEIVRQAPNHSITEVGI